LASAILPPHSHAAQALGSRKEPATFIPQGWPVWEVPNFSDWREGDIVLVEATQWPIPAAQSASLNPLMRAGANWSHAGVYVGGGRVVDAMMNPGVVMQSIWNYCQARAIKVRRICAPNVPSANVRRIASAAISYIGQAYSLPQVLLAKLGLAKHPNPSGIYCSTLVGLAVAQATGLDLSQDPAWQPLYPAILASHPWLVDVPLEWRNY